MAVGYGVVNGGTYTTDTVNALALNVGTDYAQFTVAEDGVLAIATDKFNVAATGALAICTNKFTVSAAGAVTIASTLAVTGITTLTGGSKLPCATTITTTANAPATGGIIRVDPTGGAFTLTLPTPSAENKGMVYFIKNVANVATACTVKSSTSGAFDGTAFSTGIVIAKAYGYLHVVSDGTNWLILGSSIA